MSETHLATFALAMLASFVWMQWNRSNGRVRRTLGVVVLLGAWVIYRWMERT